MVMCQMKDLRKILKDNYITFLGSKIIIYGDRHQYRIAEVVDLLNPDLECDVPFHENATGKAGYGGRIDDDFVYCGGFYRVIHLKKIKVMSSHCTQGENRKIRILDKTHFF